MFKKLIILLFCLLCTVISLPVTNEDPKVENHANKLEDDEHRAAFRLSHDTEPRLYKIEFDPDFRGEKFTFKGNGTILFEVLKPTTSVTLHRSKKIVIEKNSIEIIDEKGIFHQPLKQKRNRGNNLYTMKFEKELEPGNYTLKIKWVSNNCDHYYCNNEGFSKSSGFFRVKEDYESENSDYLIATFFKPINARTVFPCWDEPGFKAQFELSIKHFPNYTALSNMPEKSHQQLSDGRILTQFERSVKMSSYNLCIIVANCKSVRSSDRNISFYGLKDDVESLQLPLKISESVVKILEDYTGISYALPKLDHFVIPEAMPALENWGLITHSSMFVMYRNTTLIPNVQQYDTSDFLVAHEVSHQWFGNLVTSVWWNDLWLSEAFATFFSFKAMAQIRKDTPIMDYFTIQNINVVLDLELQLNLGKPIKWEPTNKNTIDKIFGSGIYFKGAGVIQMLESIVSESVFRDGIRRYLKAHQFSTATSDNLWEAIQEAYNEAHGENSLNIKEIMEPWILQKGIPVLTVTRNYETGETNITQENSLGNKWHIPISYATESNPDFSSPLPTLWMDKGQKTITLPSINKDDWIIVNVQQKGYYKVNYDRANWDRLTKYLINNHEKIHPANRAQLMMSAISLVKEDPSNIDILFKLALYLHREKDYVPWMFIGQLSLSLLEEFHKVDYENRFIDSIRYLTDAIGKSDIFHEENLESIRIRKVLAPLLCDVNNTNCLSNAHELFDQFINNPSGNAFPESDWYWVICTGLKEANDSVWERFTSDKDPLTNFIPESNYKIVKCTNDFEKRDKYLMKLLKSESKLLTSFVNEVITDFLDSNRQDVNYIMDFIFNHFEEIERFYNQSGNDHLMRIITKMSSVVQNQDQVDKVKSLVAAHRDKLKEIFSGFSSIDQLVETTQHSISIPIEFLPELKALFDEYFTREIDGSLKLKNI